MRVFLDFEASSLHEDSYPIEVGWAFEDGESDSRLIRPAPGWTDWDPSAEAVHGITRAELDREGEPPSQVVEVMLEALGGHELYASAPSWDGKWLSVLLRAAGRPRHALRVRASEEARATAVAEALSTRIAPPARPLVSAWIRKEVERRRRSLKPRHRALPDALEELSAFQLARRLAEEAETLPLFSPADPAPGLFSAAPPDT